VVSFHWLMRCLIEQVHLDYLEAGADIIITASYQVITMISLSLSLCGTYTQFRLNVDRPPFRDSRQKVFPEETVKPCSGKVWKLLVRHEMYIMIDAEKVLLMEVMMVGF